MKKLLAIALAIMTLISACVFFGCDEEPEAPKPEEVFIGSWEFDIDMTEMMDEQMGSDPTMGKYFDFKDLSFTLNVEYKNDGTYSAKIDETSIDAFITSVTAAMKSGMTKYFEDMIAQTPEMEGMTVDQVLAALGTDLDTLITSTVTKESLMESFGETNTSGVYKIEENKLYMAETTEEINDEYVTFDIINNDEIKITELVELVPAETGEDDVDASFFEDALFPLIFKRIK